MKMLDTITIGRSSVDLYGAQVGDHRDAKRWRCGRVLRTERRHSRAHILTASATTIHGKGNATGSSRVPDYSVIPGNPSTE